MNLSSGHGHFCRSISLSCMDIIEALSLSLSLSALEYAQRPSNPRQWVDQALVLLLP